MKNVKQVASLLIRRGSERVNDVVVKTASISEDGSWIILHLNQNVPMMVQKTIDGVVTFERGVGNTLFVTPISVNAVLGNNPELSNLRSLILSDDENLRDLLSYATIDVIQEPVKEGDEYTSPWAEDDAETREVKHDSYFTHLIGLEPGEAGWELIDTLKEVKNEFRKQQALEALKERAASRGKRTMARRGVKRSVAVEDTNDAEEAADEAEEEAA